ncbi:MAG TPA: S53 family peptidase [Actinospica sp.]|nr:S53 family peptidase [Actinospica sp.]
MGTPNVDNVQRGSEADGTNRSGSRPRAFRRLGIPAAMLSVALGAAQLAAAAPGEAATASSTSRVAIGSAPALPQGAVAAAAPAASKKLSLDIELNTGHAAELTSYASGVGDKNSPYYHQYLKPSQVAQYFGASSAEVAAVQNTLKGEGLSVGSLSTNGMFLSASGTVTQLQHAFGVTINGYRADGRTFYANTTAPTVPSSIAGDLSQIAGLDNVEYALPNLVNSGHKVKVSATSKKATSNYTVNSCSDIANAFDGSGYSNGAGYYTADALSQIYNLNPLLTSGNDGAGVTVAVFELENYDPAGVAAIDNCYGHSNSVSEVKVDGGPTQSANQYTGVGIEAALDIETIANLAPGASIIDYAGPDENQSVADILNTYETIFNQDRAQVVSTSWGLCEPLTQLNSTSLQAEENALFEQAAVQGQSVVAATGDQGSTACYGEGVTADNSKLTVQDPATQPFVTSVGGTNMTGTGTTTPQNQTVWNSTFSGNHGAGGGGVSGYWNLPSYQSSLTGTTGYSAHCTLGSSGCRMIPDVSALADPNNGYMIEEIYNDGAGTDGEYYNIIGGTSGAAPLWAAVLALADATSSCQANGNAGFVSPNLYAAGEGASASSTFNDVTSGNNGISAFGAPYAYPATAGYDMASGWGSPNATGVVSTVCAGNVISPSSYFVADGPTRIMDTRPGRVVGPVTGPVGKSATIKLPVLGSASGVPNNGTVTAVVLNVTAVLPTVGGNATVYPDGTQRPLASNLNWTVSDTIPNLVVVPVGKDGDVDFYNNSGGTLNFLADVEGYFTTSSTGASTYTPFGPARVADTRANHLVGTVTGPLAAGSTTALQVAGQQGLPDASSMSSVVLNVTVTQPTSSGNLTVYPAGGTKPSSSNINYTANETIANLVIVPLSADGQIDIYNNSGGTVQYVVDVAGYFSTGTSGAKFHVLGPDRLLDTRSGQGESSPAPIAKDSSITLPLPSYYSAVIANLTVTAPTSNGDLDAFPAGGATPSFSNVNFSPKETIPNLAFIPSNGGVSLYNHSIGTTQALLDLAGYFSAS